MADLRPLLDAALASARADAGQYGDAHWRALQALQAHAGPALVDAAAAWCASPDPVARALGADILGQLDMEADAAAILVPLLRDAEPRVVACAVQALAQRGAADVAQLAPLAGHPSTDVRHAVAQALGGHPDADAVPVLLTLMADRDVAVRRWATFALASRAVDLPEVSAALVSLLDDPDADARGEAMIGLARRGDPRAVPAILRELAAAEPMPLAVDAAEAFLEVHPAHAEVAGAFDAWRTANRRTLPWLGPPPRE